MEAPIGTIMAFAGPIYYSKKEAKGVDQEIIKLGIKNLKNLASTGWLPCKGKPLSKDDPQFLELYSAINDLWGKKILEREFKLPDLQGLFLRGVSNASNRDPDAMKRIQISPGGAVGNMVGSYQSDGFKNHSHLIPGGYGIDLIEKVSLFKTAQYHYYDGQTSKEGDTETRPVNAYVNYIIKASNSPIDINKLTKDNRLRKKK